MKSNGTGQRMTDYEDHRFFIRGAVDVEEAGGQEAAPGVRTDRARTGVNNTQRVRAEEAGPDGRALSD